MSIHISNQRRRSGRGRILGCFTILLIAGASLLPLAFVFGPMVGLNFGIDIAQFLGFDQVPTTEPISGDPAFYNPIAAFDEAAAFAGEDVQLVSVDAYYVRSDGTMDLTATYTPAPNTSYEFVREIPRPDDAPPPGVSGNTTNGPWYQPIRIRVSQPGQYRQFTSRGSDGNISVQYVNEGMERSIGQPTTNIDTILPPPTCNFATMWEYALGAGASSEAVAVIRYDEAGYRFSISGELTLQFNPQCQLIE